MKVLPDEVRKKDISRMCSGGEDSLSILYPSGSIAPSQHQFYHLSQFLCTVSRFCCGEVWLQELV